MARGSDKQGNIFGSVDRITVALYLALMVFGWISVCGASYTFGDNDIFSLGTRSGMQIVWIATSVCLAVVILAIDQRFFDSFSYIIYGVMMLLLFATIFNPHSVRGSQSWLELGPLRVQPAEFGKFATALALSKIIGTYGFTMSRWKHFAAACAVVLLPVCLIIGQKETGSALVYLSFFLMFYREGMPGGILFTGIAMVVYFVVGIKYEGVALWGTPTSLGRCIVYLLVYLFTAGIVYVYRKDVRLSLLIVACTVGVTLLALVVTHFFLPIDLMWLQIALGIVMALFLLYRYVRDRIATYAFAALFAVGSMGFFYSADYVLNEVMGAHQRVRINVLLGLEDDLAGAGYNVHQSEIAIGSGGLAGKGFLNGTQTKLKFVPEQDTDFIFCTVGEEEGFLGSAAVLLLFLALILRLIHLAERQPFRSGRVYGYCVMSIFFFHIFINVGMVLGLTPVIGIPLPFFSYGGSSLWGFTILLFIFLRMDAAGRHIAR